MKSDSREEAKEEVYPLRAPKGDDETETGKSVAQRETTGIFPAQNHAVGNQSDGLLSRWNVSAGANAEDFGLHGSEVQYGSGRVRAR